MGLKPALTNHIDERIRPWDGKESWAEYKLTQPCDQGDECEVWECPFTAEEKALDICDCGIDGGC